MKTPIQIWAPAIDISPYNEKGNVDLERVQREWMGEIRLWMSPNVDRKISWEEDPGVFESLVPAYEYNIIDIYHIDKRGKLYPRLSSSDDWQGIIPDDLYLQWLKARVRPVRKTDIVVFNFPVIERGKIVIKPLQFRPSPGTPVAGMIVDEDDKSATVLGPLRPRDRKAISLQIESKHLYGKTKWEVNGNGQETGFVLSENIGRFKGQSYRFEWEEPFNRMYELETSLDTLYIRSRIMEAISNLNESNHSKVLNEFQPLHNRFVRTSYAPLSHVKYLPWMNSIPTAEERNYLLWNLQEDDGIPVETIADLKSSPEFIELLQRPEKVICINTWTGFFVCQFVKDLRDLKPVGVCENCGNIIRGGDRDRRFCTRKENAECVQELNTIAQRRRRQRIREEKQGDEK